MEIEIVRCALSEAAVGMRFRHICKYSVSIALACHDVRDVFLRLSTRFIIPYCRVHFYAYQESIKKTYRLQNRNELLIAFSVHFCGLGGLLRIMLLRRVLREQMAARVIAWASDICTVGEFVILNHRPRALHKRPLSPGLSVIVNGD
jgi:hypothetical protein